MNERPVLPSIEDTHNWRQEIEPYRVNDWSFKPPNVVDFASRKQVEPLDISIPIRLAELIWDDPELKDAVRARKAWFELVDSEPFMNPDHPRWDELPGEAFDLLGHFEAWYILRVGLPVVYLTCISFAEAICFSMLDGEFTSFGDVRLREYLLDHPGNKYFDARE